MDRLQHVEFGLQISISNIFLTSPVHFILENWDFRQPNWLGTAWSSSGNCTGEFDCGFDLIRNVRYICCRMYAPCTICKDSEGCSDFLARNGMFQLTVFKTNRGCRFCHEANLCIGCSKIQCLFESIVHPGSIKILCRTSVVGWVLRLDDHDVARSAGCLKSLLNSVFP